MIERKLEPGTVTDLMTISDGDWWQACLRFNAVKTLAEHPPGTIGTPGKGDCQGVRCHRPSGVGSRSTGKILISLRFCLARRVSVWAAAD